MATTIAPNTTHISPAELRRLRQEDPHLRLLDVRTGGEFESEHIPGAYNVPLDTLSEHVVDLADLEHPVVLVCRSGGRASTAHEKLQAAGKESLMILEGGMDAWRAAAGDVVENVSERWAMDRQVRLVAGSMVLGAVAASIAVPRLKWLAAGVGAGLTYSALSNTCAMANVLAKLPYNQTSCDIEGVLEEMRG